MNLSKKVPTMLSLKALAKETGLPEYTIRRLYKDGKIVGIKTGKKILINLEKFIDFVNNSKNFKEEKSNEY